MFNVIRSRRALMLAGPAALVLSAAVACSSSTAASPSGNLGSPSGSSSSSSGAALSVTSNASLGQIVTTGSGLTVYRYDADSANPAKSNCTGTCASYWPPVLVTGSSLPNVTGVNATLLGEVTRSDGSKQLTLAGWPLYTFVKDTAAGAVTGENYLGKWWAVTPTGDRAKTASGN